LFLGRAIVPPTISAYHVEIQQKVFAQYAMIAPFWRGVDHG
jgi:hypothetical protein